MALNSFPEMVTDILSRSSRQQNVTLLQTALIDGHFHFSQGFNEGYVDDAFDKVDAVLDFMKASKTRVVFSDDEGVESEPLIDFEASPAMAAFYGDFTERCLREMQRLDLSNPTLQALASVDDLAFKMAAGAIAIGNTAALEKVLDMHPDVVSHQLLVTRLGGAFSDSFNAPENTTATLSLVALQHGRENALRVLFGRGADPVSMGETLESVAGGGVSGITFDAVSGLTSRFALGCSSSPYALALSQWIACKKEPTTVLDENETKVKQIRIDNDLHRASQLALEDAARPQQSARLTPAVVAFESLGVYQKEPELSFDTMCQVGLHAMTRNVKGPLDWTIFCPIDDPLPQQKRKHLVMATMRKGLSEKVVNDTLETIALRAMEEGVFDKVFKPSPEYNDSMSIDGAADWVEQPVSLIIDQGRSKMLVTLLEQGMDPSAQAFELSLSAMAYAKATGQEEMVHTMQTFLNRKKALSLLGGMEFYRAPKVDP